MDGETEKSDNCKELTRLPDAMSKNTVGVVDVIILLLLSSATPEESTNVSLTALEEISPITVINVYFKS